MGVLALISKESTAAHHAEKLSQENIQAWKDWWTKNQDQAVFVQKPVPTFEY